jgi:predicted phage gp36 major capsid-like protein
METEGNLLQELVEALNAGEGLRGLPPARLRELASHARALRQEVEERWEDLPLELRKAFEGLARSWEETPPFQGNASEDLGEFLREVTLLSRAVTDRLEEEDPAFREALNRALAEESEPWRGLDSLELDP